MTRPYRTRKREKSPRLRDQYYYILYARINHETMAEIDAMSKRDKCPRSETIRYLVETGLSYVKNGAPWPG